MASNCDPFCAPAIWLSCQWFMRQRRGASCIFTANEMLRFCFCSGCNPWQKLHFDTTCDQIGKKQNQDGANSASRTDKNIRIAKRLRRSCANSYFCATVTSRQKFKTVSTCNLWFLPFPHVLVMSLEIDLQNSRCGWNASTQPFPLARGMLSGKSPKWSGLPWHEPRPYRRALIVCNSKACRKAGIELIFQFSARKTEIHRRNLSHLWYLQNQTSKNSKRSRRQSSNACCRTQNTFSPPPINPWNEIV